MLGVLKAQPVPTPNRQACHPSEGSRLWTLVLLVSQAPCVTSEQALEVLGPSFPSVKTRGADGSPSAFCTHGAYLLGNLAAEPA